MRYAAKLTGKVKNVLKANGIDISVSTAGSPTRRPWARTVLVYWTTISASTPEKAADIAQALGSAAKAGTFTPGTEVSRERRRVSVYWPVGEVVPAPDLPAAPSGRRSWAEIHTEATIYYVVATSSKLIDGRHERIECGTGKAGHKAALIATMSHSRAGTPCKVAHSA